MRIHHVLCKTRDMLIAGLVKLLLDIALHLLYHVVCPVIWVGTVSAPGVRLVVVHHLLYLDHHGFVVTKVREKLMDRRNLWNRHLVVELLVVRTMVLVIRKLTLIRGVMASLTSGEFVAFLYLGFLELEIRRASSWELCRQIFWFSCRIWKNVLCAGILGVLFFVTLAFWIINRWPPFLVWQLCYWLKNFQLLVLNDVGNVL